MINKNLLAMALLATSSFLTAQAQSPDTFQGTIGKSLADSKKYWSPVNCAKSGLKLMKLVKADDRPHIATGMGSSTP